MDNNSWVIFDADNTLWNIEHLYNEARSELCRYLSKKGNSLTAVENFQRERDSELYLTYGYSACRFARSFEDTAIYFLGNSDINSIKHCRSIALQVFDKSPIVNPDLETIFSTLKSDYKLGLITAGERWVQERRLSEFHFANEIDCIKVVEEKTVEVIQQFIEENSIEVSTSWMIGDSLRSDIKPATAVNLNVIWYRNNNWDEHENGDNEIPDTGVHQTGNLIDILKLIEVGIV